MAKILQDFIDKFHETCIFKEEKKSLKGTGSKMTGINLTPSAAFEILEVLFGEYEDVNAGYIFIDDKTHWERYFSTPNGVLRIYDYRGMVSIGSQVKNILEKVSEEYRKDAESLKTLIEDAAEKYKAVKEQSLEAELTENPMNNFSRAFLSTKILIERARNNNSLLELLVLNATLLDAKLRLAIILSTQLKEKHSNVQREMIIQESKTFISERKVYTIAKDLGILNDVDFTEVNELYDFRNTAIHRYFISGLEYRHIEQFIRRYENINTKIGNIVADLEQQQINTGIGMTKPEDIAMGDDVIREIQRQELLKIDSSIPVAVVPKRKFMFREDDEQ